MCVTALRPLASLQSGRHNEFFNSAARPIVLKEKSRQNVNVSKSRQNAPVALFFLLQQARAQNAV